MNLIAQLFLKVISVPRFVRKHYYWRLNKAILYALGANVGRNLQIYNKFYFKTYGSPIIEIGDDCTITSGESFNPLCRNIRGSLCLLDGAVLKIGDNVGMSSPCLWAQSGITIGNNVKIGGDCIIMDRDAHCLDATIRRMYGDEKYWQRPDNYEFLTSLCRKYEIPIKKAIRYKGLDGLLSKSAPIIIGDDVLIGTRCVILKGVTIGARSVIAAGSVVTRSIPEDCIAGGNPCKVIRIVGC